MQNDKSYIQVGNDSYISIICMRMIFESIPVDKQIEFIGKPINELNDEQLKIAYNQYRENYFIGKNSNMQ